MLPILIFNVEDGCTLHDGGFVKPNLDLCLLLSGQHVLWRKLLSYNSCLTVCLSYYCLTVCRSYYCCPISVALKLLF
ncbi:hypothetical protein Bpfe_022246 [Biomphalaria pfeifferi]|uniref:Uncharacterized protein n=1 Tax=Biomphalaria pfeifferi TaxID=112525 RepID=A0AAD8F343_BIOPF|nr:hypothetical protein Bpfe_022246 [Biomphalaria pfeifferi]